MDGQYNTGGGRHMYLHDHSTGHAVNIQGDTSTARSEISAQRFTSDNGTRRCTTQRAHEILGTSIRENSLEISELGTHNRSHPRSDGGSGDGIAPLTAITTQAPSWNTLTGKRNTKRNDLPLHIKPAVLGALNLTALQALPQRESMHAKLLHAMRWIQWSPMYDIIQQQLSTYKLRQDRLTFTSGDIMRLWDVRKLRTPPDEIYAYCNGFPRVEEREEGDRRRPLFEPLINDIIANTPALATTTQYTKRDDIRRAVYHAEAGAQFDYAAWFDQISLAEEIQCFFGVRTSPTPCTLPYVPMGFRPSCEVAEAITESIAHDPDNPGDVFVATCVDNILFLGNSNDLQRSGDSFVARSAQVGAILKDARVTITRQYDFLGEHYDHTTKTRALTEKTRLKCAYVNKIIGTRPLTTRQFMAIIGLLIYASNTLRILLARYHFVLRHLASLARTPLDEKQRTPTHIADLIRDWSATAMANVAVNVWDPEEEPLYTDASAEGWGVMSINRNGTIIRFGQPWSMTDRNLWNVNSSVAAEPLAIRKAVATMVPVWAKNVMIYTDHEPMIFAAQKTVGKAYSYSAVLRFLGEFQTRFHFRFVEGILNPADPLSRHFTQPKLLNVTRIGNSQHTAYTNGREGAMGLVDGQGREQYG